MNDKIKKDSDSDDSDSTIAQSRYVNQNYQSDFLSELRQFFVSRKFTDVNLICGSKQDSSHLVIPCHKLVLSAFSSYFLAMFTSDLIENKTNQVYMPNTDFATLNELINYAYTGSINLNVNNVQNIFSLASLLCLKEIIEACTVYMISQLDVNNSLDVYCFAKHHMCTDLLNKSKEFINRNICEIFRSNEFLLIDNTDLVHELLSSDDLNVQCEEVVLSSLLKWIDFDFEKRKDLFETLLQAIRLEYVDVKFLNDIYSENENLFTGNTKCKQIFDDYLRNDSTSVNTRSSFITNKRIGMIKPDYVFLLIGGNCDMEDGFYVNCVNPHTGEKFFVSRSFLEKSKSITKGFFHLENPGVCVTEDDRIFVCGGNYVYHEYKFYNNADPTGRKSNRSGLHKQDFDKNERDCFVDSQEHLSKETYEYDRLNDTWIRRANMLFPKANFSLCAMNDKIYSFGGVTTDQDQLDIVEYYDIDQNKWHYVGKMPTAFIAGAVVKIGGEFFVMGGRSGIGRFNKCWKFKPDNCEWSEIKKMKIGRFNFGACVINTKIYVFGGQRYNESEQSYYTREALDSVEIYDALKDEWVLGLEMPSPLYNTGVCIYDDQMKCIYVCGTTECKFSGNTLLGFMFTSVYRLELLNGTEKMKWTVVEHDLSDIKSNYRCVAARLNTRKLYKCNIDIK